MLVFENSTIDLKEIDLTTIDFKEIDLILLDDWLFPTGIDWFVFYWMRF